MIKVLLLNNGASLNDFFHVNSMTFVPGENVVVPIHIYDSQRDIRLIPPSAAIVTMTFTDKDGNDINKTPTLISADDRSMWVTTLSKVESLILAGQNVVVTLDYNGDGTLIYKALLANAIIRTNLSGDC